MKRDNRVKFRGNRFKVIAVLTFAMTVFAFVCGAFLALQTSEKSSPSPPPPETPKPASTPVRQPKRLPPPTLPPPNTQNNKDPKEDRD